MADDSRKEGWKIPEGAKDRARELFDDWKRFLATGWEKAEEFTKEKPAAGLATSFIVGFLLASWLRRRD
jgi:hypothetical protein